MTDKKLETKEELKKSETPAAEAKTEAAATTETPAATETKATEAPVEVAPTLAAGLFKEFTLGSRLAPGPTGNIMTNMKKPSMDYEKVYQNSTKNESLTEEQLKQLVNKK